MAEMVLPGVYVEVRPEGLIVPGRVGVNTVGIVGTAGRGALDTPVVLGSYTEAVERFGPYDRWLDGASDELTLTRALELVFMHGATTVIAVRVGAKDANGNPTASAGTVTLNDASAAAVATLDARSPGTWGNDLRVNVWDADEPPFVEAEEHNGAPANLTHSPVLKSARNRIEQFEGATGFTRTLEILYDGDPAPTGRQVLIDRATGGLTFGTPPDTADKIVASYAVDAASGVKVTIRQMRGAEVAAEETYTVVSGTDLVTTVNDELAPSALVTASAGAGGLPAKSESATAFLPFTGGANGAEAGAGDYKAGLDLLLNEDAHIMVAAGQDASFADELDAHCQNASTDAIKHDRIGVIGSGLGAAGSLDAVRGHTIASDRIVFVAPGVQVNDSAGPGQPLVNLPGSYAAAAVAGRLAFYPAHVSLTNKTLAVSGLTEVFTPPQLGQLLKARVLPLERRQGFRIVRGITTSTNSAWLQITTRRIVDYAKYGVRSAAEPYIGLLNNSRVRGAMRATINSFLSEMVEDEMLVGYELDVTATRDDERKGVAKVTMVLRPVFSIDFIKVTMFLE
ncbi:MAG: phage tail sheath subtilisin-like domain-containing protein [Actinomycetota bacterium]|nr:phage tail sheath subtilisin-like domain-containing protein [Actinomycetota bacterium]